MKKVKMAVVDTTPVKNVAPKGLGVRHLQTLFLFFGMLLFFTMRVNISMAIVQMTDSTREHYFNWGHQTQSVILSSFFWGYVVTQIPSGELCRRWGGKNTLLTAMLFNTIVSLLLPQAAFWSEYLSAGSSWKVVCACRVLQGLTQACVYPSMHHLCSQWIPIEEKGLLTTIIYAGAVLGISCQLLASGFIAMAWGWQAIFYTNGASGIIWTVFFFLFGSASPEQSKIISEEEVAYIQNSLGRVGELKRHPTPWLKIITSLPFWALIVAHCGQNWGFFTLMTETPTYMARVLGIKLTNNGALSCLPYLAMFTLSFVLGAGADLVVRRSWLSITNQRKLFNTIGLWGPAAALIGLAYTPPGDMTYAVSMLTLAVGLNAGQYTGFMLIHMDLAPNFSASLMGITNFLANIISIIAPLVCGVIVQHESDPMEWREVFFIAAGVYFFCNLFFVCFVTSDRQPWNEPKSADIEMISSEKPNHRQS